MRNEAFLRIIKLSLLDQIKLPMASRVSTNTRQILPIPPVAGYVKVNQLMLEMTGSITPILTEFMDKTAGN